MLGARQLSSCVTVCCASTCASSSVKPPTHKLSLSALNGERGDLQPGIYSQTSDGSQAPASFKDSSYGGGLVICQSATLTHTHTHTETCTTACIVPSRTTEPTDTPLRETFVSENGGREERLLYILLWIELKWRAIYWIDVQLNLCSSDKRRLSMNLAPTQ